MKLARNRPVSAPTTHGTAAAVLAALLCAPAASLTVDVHGVVKLGDDFGGDTMVEETLVSSLGTSTEKIKANEGLVLAGGLSVMNDARNFSVDATIGRKSEQINASNQDFEFTRFPVDVIAFCNLPLGDKGKFRLRFGAGMTYHINPEFPASGDLANGSVDFDNAAGFVGQIDTVLGPGQSGLNFGLRYTALEYQADGVPAFKANGAGLFVAGMF